MAQLSNLGEQIGRRRKILGLTQTTLAQTARISRATLDALENGRLGELGFSKLTRVLSALGLEMRLQQAEGRRPTLEDLMEEDRDDQGMDRRR